MREIKFRCYWKDYKEMHYPKHIDMENCKRDNEVELMQFTGLKDKNSVEIYEGDIVNCCINHQNKTNLKGVLEWSSVNLFIKDKDEIMYSFNGASHVEVIGNIYESPELLKS